jgi:hypothetical protein
VRNRGIEIRRELPPRGSGRRRQGAHDQPSAHRKPTETVGAEMLQLPTDPVAHNCAADLTTDHESSSGTGRLTRIRLGAWLSKG